MQKTYFFNHKSISENLEIKKIPQVNVNTKIRVDINKLLNRVKIEKKNESKKKFIFFGFGFTLVSLMGAFLIIVK